MLGVVVKSKRRNRTGRKGGRLPDCDGRYRCISADCLCEYEKDGKKPGGKPESGYPEDKKNTSFKQHINALQKRHPGSSKDDFVTKGPYTDAEGKRYFGRCAPLCVAQVCLGAAKGWQHFLPTEPCMDELVKSVEEEGGIASDDDSMRLLPQETSYMSCAEVSVQNGIQCHFY
jgi:hypothetical protein